MYIVNNETQLSQSILGCTYAKRVHIHTQNSNWIHNKNQVQYKSILNYSIINNNTNMSTDIDKKLFEFISFSVYFIVFIHSISNLLPPGRKP